MKLKITKSKGVPPPGAGILDVALSVPERKPQCFLNTEAPPASSDTLVRIQITENGSRCSISVEQRVGNTVEPPEVPVVKPADVDETPSNSLPVKLPSRPKAWYNNLGPLLRLLTLLDRLLDNVHRFMG